MADVALTIELDLPPEWVTGAVCAQTDPDEFFPNKGGTTRYAKAVCRGCPVREECLQYALDNHERFGIWGGMSERERRKLETRLSAGRPNGSDSAIAARVLDLTELGWSAREIAEEVGCADRTVVRIRSARRGVAA